MRKWDKIKLAVLKVLVKTMSGCMVSQIEARSGCTSY